MTKILGVIAALASAIVIELWPASADLASLDDSWMIISAAMTL